MLGPLLYVQVPGTVRTVVVQVTGTRIRDSLILYDVCIVLETTLRQQQLDSISQSVREMPKAWSQCNGMKLDGKLF